MKILLDGNDINNPLVLVGSSELAKIREKDTEWEIRKDRFGENMVFYRNIPADEIIYCVGEISLAMTSHITTLQREYYEENIADVFNLAVKLIRDNKSAEEFYENYYRLKNSL